MSLDVIDATFVSHSVVTFPLRRFSQSDRYQSFCSLRYRPTNKSPPSVSFLRGQSTLNAVPMSRNPTLRRSRNEIGRLEGILHFPVFPIANQNTSFNPAFLPCLARVWNQLATARDRTINTFKMAIATKNCQMLGLVLLPLIWETFMP